MCSLFSVGETLNPAWLALLVDSNFHGTLCSLFTRAAFLIRLLDISDDVRYLCDPLTLKTNVQDIFNRLNQNGVQFSDVFSATVAGGDLPL